MLEANAKVGKSVIKEDQHNISSNGKIMLDLVERHDLMIINSMNICEGVVTRERKFDDRVERSSIDYIITCEDLSNYITEMMIDEDRIHTLSRCLKKKTGSTIIKSDNILLANFYVTFKRMSGQVRKEHFVFKCEESKKTSLDETNTTKLLSSSFKEAKNFPQCSHKIFRNLNSMFHKCFKKVRIRSGKRKTHGDETIQKKVGAQTALKMRFLNHKCKETEESTKSERN